MGIAKKIYIILKGMTNTAVESVTHPKRSVTYSPVSGEILGETKELTEPEILPPAPESGFVKQIMDEYKNPLSKSGFEKK